MIDPNIPKSKIMKDDFNWEVPVENVPLPSKGVIYSPDSRLYNTEFLKIKAMTALEEDIISSPAYIKDGIAVHKVIESCLEDKSVEVQDLITGDRNALMISIRITGYGADYNVVHQCRNCGSSNDVTVNLNELEINRLDNNPVVDGENLFSYKLPVTGKEVRYKFLTGRDEKEENAKQKQMQKLGIIKHNSVTSLLENCIVSIDGITDKNKITHFIKNMPARDSRKLRLHIKASEPGINMKWSYGCPKCSSSNTFAIPITSEFFWPST